MKNKYGRGSGNTHPVNIHVGNQLRSLRKQHGNSQKELAEKIGVTFQQIQKYEMGRNRVTASTLWEVSQIFNVSILYFYEGYSQKNNQAQAAEAAPVWWTRLYFGLEEWQIKAVKDFITTIKKIKGSSQ